MGDAVVVLGRGVHVDGSLPPDAQARVRKAVELYVAGEAPIIIMSGAWTFHLNVKPLLSEAAAMQVYAEQLGVVAQDIITESQSVDTIGNIYFVKNQICQRQGWKNLIFVASEEHLPRISYICDKILGPDYSYTFASSHRVLNDQEYRVQVEHEQKSMVITRRWLDTITPGDDAAVWHLMQTIHPGYAPNLKRTTNDPQAEVDLYPDMP